MPYPRALMQNQGRAMPPPDRMAYELLETIHRIGGAPYTYLGLAQTGPILNQNTHPAPRMHGMQHGMQHGPAHPPLPPAAHAQLAHTGALNHNQTRNYNPTRGLAPSYARTPKPPPRVAQGAHSAQPATHRELFGILIPLAPPPAQSPSARGGSGPTARPIARTPAPPPTHGLFAPVDTTCPIGRAKPPPAPRPRPTNGAFPQLFPGGLCPPGGAPAPSLADTICRAFFPAPAPRPRAPTPAAVHVQQTTPKVPAPPALAGPVEAAPPWPPRDTAFLAVVYPHRYPAPRAPREISSMFASFSRDVDSESGSGSDMDLDDDEDDGWREVRHAPPPPPAQAQAQVQRPAVRITVPTAPAPAKAHPAPERRVLRDIVNRIR